jgi:hypothetical protein
MVNRILYFFPFPMLLTATVMYSTRDEKLARFLMLAIAVCSLSYSIYFLSSIG